MDRELEMLLAEIDVDVEDEGFPEDMADAILDADFDELGF